MISHATIKVSDYQASKKFYQEALAPLGYTFAMEFGEYGGFSDGKHLDFWVAKSDGGVVPTHLAFLAKSKEEVQGFYDAALKAGAKDNGSPGYRADYSPGYYAAFVYDPDGNNIEAMFSDSSKE